MGKMQKAYGKAKRKATKASKGKRTANARAKVKQDRKSRKY